MQLKSIEMQGFKSFPDKTRLAFEKPVTVIVGPNGSGKSNIADALLWVMGEQSTRTLRGGKMEDVIFGGTQKRPQLGFAEVSLLLENEDGSLDIDTSEVMITRRYYRSGESEYYINRRNARLRDINELLMDTGLGREGYSVIGQGKIDEILSAKSRDRRDVFEEAVGISRYRHRKQESEHKLAQTDENLVRISDKIAELEMQLEPLREQSETAKRYLLLRDELRGLEVSLWALGLDKLRQSEEKLKLDYAAATEELATRKSALEQAYADIETFAERLRAKDVALDDVRGVITEREQRVSEAETALAALKTQLENNLSRIEGIHRDLQSEEGRDGGITSQIAERERRISEIADESGTANAALSELEAQLATLKEQSGREENEYFALSEREREVAASLGERRERVSALALQAQELLDRENTAHTELSRMTDELAELSKSADGNKSALDKAREEDSALQNVVSGFNMRVTSRREKSEDAERERSRLSLEHQSTRQRIAMLTEMENEYQGYSKAVKLVMTEASRGGLKNVYGTVAGLLKTDARFAVAIETALGAGTQNILVGNEEDGKSAINMLKRRDGGRATFLPVSTIRGSVLRENGLAEEDGFLGLGIELVSFEKRFEGVYANQLGRVAIVETMDDAIRIARRFSNRFKLVTLDGQVINAGGSMTGGSTSKNSGILSRANELEALGEYEKGLAQKTKKAEGACAERARELKAAEYELEVARADKRVVEDRVLKLESEAGHVATLLADKERAIASHREIIELFKQRVTENTAETDTTRGEIQNLASEFGTLQTELSTRAEGRENATEQREALQGKMAERQTTLAALEAEREAVAKAMEELAAIRADLTGRRETQLETAEQLKVECGELNVKIDERNRAIHELRVEIEGLHASVLTITNEKLAIEGERATLERESRDDNKSLLDLERECARLEQRHVTLGVEEKQLVDKLWDTYEVNRSDAMTHMSDIEEPREAERRVSALKSEISKLGNPNIGAIEEFDRVNTRYTFLAEQRDDVEKAKNELNAIIDEITEQMREIFLREFAIINSSFSETFTELFGGGKASLELDDPNDVLGCGIEIHVQPPGKSLKTLTLLSGGEKAFVAIALYFAILRVRPTPFVVLDEIEAALDDANVQRFADYMRRMSARSQMIVISHRRGTMEEADVLYGVTMQEQGVSRILSIDLGEAEQTIETRR
ncbi:MAG: chromosome segregation protein SMC [Oscillospiraceae bacterium]|nr:chromosome segregation protein SMC [Oscillospiraceae bacterium]